MRKIMMFCLIACAMLSVTAVFAETPSLDDEYEVVGNKIYILPDQLYITENSIYIFIEGEKVLIHQLNCDEKGIYCYFENLDRITDKCRNGHKIWCGRCGGCLVRWCLFHCKCVEWRDLSK